MKPTYVETIPESVSAGETQAASRKYCPTQDETSTPFVAPKAQPIVQTDPSDLTGMAGLTKEGKKLKRSILKPCSADGIRSAWSL